MTPESLTSAELQAWVNQGDWDRIRHTPSAIRVAIEDALEWWMGYTAEGSWWGISTAVADAGCIVWHDQRITVVGELWRQWLFWYPMTQSDGTVDAQRRWLYASDWWPPAAIADHWPTGGRQAVLEAIESGRIHPAGVQHWGANVWLIRTEEAERVWVNTPKTLSGLIERSSRHGTPLATSHLPHS